MAFFLEHVVGAHDRRVAPSITAAKIAFFKHRDITNAVVFGEIKGTCHPMPTGTDDNHVRNVFLGFGSRQARAPVFVPSEGRGAKDLKRNIQP